MLLQESVIIQLSVKRAENLSFVTTLLHTIAIIWNILRDVSKLTEPNLASSHQIIFVDLEYLPCRKKFQKSPPRQGLTPLTAGQQISQQQSLLSHKMWVYVLHYPSSSRLCIKLILG